MLWLFVGAEVPEKRVVSSSSLSQTMLLCQETVIKWFANYTMSLRKPTDPASQQTARSRLVTQQLASSSCLAQ